MLKAEEIEARLREADATFNVANIAETITEMMREDEVLTFADFETVLRRMGSDTYLIARPRYVTPKGLGVAWFKAREDKPSHFLWICLHGEQEQQNEFETYDLTDASNLEALRNTCGCLAIRRNPIDIN